MLPEIQLTFYQALGIGCTIVGGFWAVAKMLATAVTKRIDEKFNALDTARESDKKEWDERYGRQERDVRDLRDRMIAVESELEHIPTKESFMQMNDRLAKLEGVNEVQTAILNRLEHQVRLQVEWMLENK